MDNFSRLLDKAAAEIGIAKAQGKMYSEQALIQAKNHIMAALNEARKFVLIESNDE
jgi:hypothetical protein